MFKKITRFLKALYKQHEILTTINQQTQTQTQIEARKHELLIHKEIDRLRAAPQHQDAKSLVPFGHKIFSQNDEDGIIKEIFHRIGTTNKVFVEFGVGNGLENNSLALLFDDWKGLWIEAAKDDVQKISDKYQAIIKQRKLKIIESFITKENINDLLTSNLNEKEIDLLSIDIDGNDYHIFNAITSISARVIVIEYNAKFAPPIMYCMDYNEKHIWQFNDCFSASLKFLEVKLREKGYCLVGCNITGANAFFVKKEIAGNKFLTPYSAENHYIESRYYLTIFSSGHPPSHETLSKSLQMKIFTDDKKQE